MITVLSIIGCVVAFFIVPLLLIFGMIGWWLFGFWGAVIGVIIGAGITESL